MTAKTKICGVSTPEAVRAAVEGGAAYLGFVMFPKSPRNIAPDAAGRLAPPARAKNVQIVALAVDPSDNEVDEIMTGLGPDLIQLHGKETPARVREIARRSGRGIIKALPISESSDVAAAFAYETVVDHLMFDAKPPKDADRPGGLGGAFDWALLAGRRFQRPWFLAGGLDSWNVAEAIAAARPPIVDVSTGVERGPGLKDPALITAFLDAVRRA
ncbi:MAG: phosphoribosylanthranilate isomerase [Alphaproteobacteria bacterium]|nr:phosphoribosylanthranilate isomerase [Alphaproteobacteria bacterium]MBU1517039.1 phosphoribosylanthranilate isomerase [Alphaproteobacteria bacterium]MBU2093658.1 phosphoribosylanthranilate isomerase [Alphaproteobacteria bacterium]MBU2154020.1 phosphoribosylanthranilate isomerase [Alphaproteobacteria bacterium]MBU2308742.1 phosphoribosylanthranilate isomerase [Alphaproteobacteria bacterium]